MQRFITVLSGAAMGLTTSLRAQRIDQKQRVGPDWTLNQRSMCLDLRLSSPDDFAGNT